MSLQRPLAAAILGICAVLAAAKHTAAQTPNGPSIKLGATLSLSGSLSYMGEREYTGMLLAVEEINGAGGVNGRPLELIVEDNLGDPKSAVSGVAKLLNADQVDVLLSAFTHITQAIKATASQSGKVLLYESSLRTIAEENPRIFRDYYDSAESGRKIGLAVLKAGHPAVAYLYESSDSCLEFIKRVQAELIPAGITTVAEESYAPGEKDFRPLFLRIRTKHPQALIMCTWRDMTVVMRQLKDSGLIKTPSYHLVAINSPESDTPEMRKLYAENSTVSTYYGLTEDAANERQAKFISAYQTRFGRPPVADAAFTYDDIHVLALALRPCTSTDAVDQDCLAEALLKTDYDGVAGRLKFNQQRVSSRPVFLIRLVDGRWQRMPE